MYYLCLIGTGEEWKESDIVIAELLAGGSSLTTVTTVELNSYIVEINKQLVHTQLSELASTARK